jgi:hypothetical protein
MGLTVFLVWFVNYHVAKDTDQNYYDRDTVLEEIGKECKDIY